MWKCHRSHEGLSTPFYTLRFWTAPVLPRARYASTQQTSRSRRQKNMHSVLASIPSLEGGFQKEHCSFLTKQLHTADQPSSAQICRIKNGQRNKIKRASNTTHKDRKVHFMSLFSLHCIVALCKSIQYTLYCKSEYSLYEHGG